MFTEVRVSPVVLLFINSKMPGVFPGIFGGSRDDSPTSSITYQTNCMTPNELLTLGALLVPGMLLSVLVMLTFSKGG